MPQKGMILQITRFQLFRGSDRRREMDKLDLKVANRETMGKKVRFLRRQGITPVHLFGHNIESVALQCDSDELKHIIAQAGKTRLINLHIEKGKKARSVMVREVQKNPLTGELLHVDLYQIKTTEKTKVDVPVILTGEAPALRLKANMLEHDLTNLHIECLPGDIPTSIELDISSLAESGDSIRVKDIILGDEITVLNDPEIMAVKISSRHMEKEEVVAEVEEEVAAEGAPEAAPSPEAEAQE